LYTAADFELDERHVIKNEKHSCIGQTPTWTERNSCNNNKGQKINNIINNNNSRCDKYIITSHRSIYRGSIDKLHVRDIS